MIFQSAISSTDLSIYSVTYPLIQFRPPFFFSSHLFPPFTSSGTEQRTRDDRGKQRNANGEEEGRKIVLTDRLYEY